MKALKLWQAILMIFGSICLVTGGVVLYTYLTNGFGNQKIEAETISFVKDENIFNANLNQLEVDSDFKLTINASNAEATEKEVTLSFGKSSSGSTVETFVVDGVTYISNGVVSIPQKVLLGEEFAVKLDQITYTYNGKSFDANAGGITTIKAKSSNILDNAGAEITVAVDVPVEKIDLTAKDTTTGKEYTIDASGVSKVLQNSNFELIVNYYPTLSRYRYSDNYFKTFHEGEEVLSVFEERVKDYCFEVVAGNNVEKKYNDGDIYFTSTGTISSGNKVKAYVFKTAKQQEDFESAGLTITGEDYYNAMLSYLAKATEGVEDCEVNFSVEQADVGNIHISLNTTESTPIEAKTNKLFTLVANNKKLGDSSLGIAIQDEEGADLSSMISQTALRIRYKKLGEVNFVDLVAGDNTLTIRSLDKFTLGNKDDTTNPYEYEGKTYFFGNSNIKDLKNTYWEFSTNEESLLVEVEVVLFITTGSGEHSVSSIFDEEGKLLGTSLRRKAFINFLPSEEDSVVWNSTNEQLNIIYNGTTQVPTQIDLAKNTNVPSGNIYQKVRYYVAKVLDGEIPPNEDTIEADDANVDTTQTYTHTDGHSYALVKSSDLLFSKAGTYYVLFVTIRTDAYGNIVDADPSVDGVQVGFEEISNIMTISVAETLQSFSAKVIIENGEKYGVFRSVAQADVDATKDNYYYKKGADGYSYELETGTPNPATTNYYELRSYAVMTGEKAAVTVDIQVSEADCTMINTELTNGRLKFYAVSSDGQTEIQLAYEDNGTKSVTIDGVDYPIVKSVKLNMPDMTISDNEGKGKSFFIKIVYDNTVEKVDTLATMESNGLSVEEEGGKRVHNCFMLYTPTARNIYSPVIKTNGLDPSDPLYEAYYLNNQTLDASISMNDEAKYEECNILLGGEVLNGLDNGKVWINDRIKETRVTDAYDRPYSADVDLNGDGDFDDEGENKDEYEVSVSAGIVSVGVMNNGLIFASGKENATISVSAGANCFYNFVIRTESSGLHKVTTKTMGASPVETEFISFSNVYVNIDGATSTSDLDYNFYAGVEIEVGTPNVSGDYTTLGTGYKYFYVNDFELENLRMFVFVDMDNNEYNTVFGSSYKTYDGNHTLTNKTPIKGFKIKENFARSYTLSIAVNSENLMTSTETPAVSFELKVNISSVVSAVANINDKFINPSDPVALADGIYAGVPYDLDKLIALKRITDDSDISWAIPYQYLNYVLNDGTITQSDDATRNDGRVSIGQIESGKITFYDVVSVTERYAKFYYFETNENAYYTETTFKVYPNLQIVKVAMPLDYLNLIELALSGNAGNAISKFCQISRIRVGGAISTATTKCQILNGDDYVVKIDGSVFKFRSGKSLELGYNEYEDTLELGVFLNGERVLLPGGGEQIYEIPVVLVPDLYDEDDPTLLLGSVEQDLLPNILRSSTGESVGTVVYDGVTTIGVSYPFEGDYLVNANQFGDASKPFFVTVRGDNGNVHNFQSGRVNFHPAADDSINGFSFGENYFLSVTIRGGSTDVNAVFDVATLKIPLYISTVGQHYAYYENYNDGHPDDPATTAINEYVPPTEGFDLKTLLYGENNGADFAPYSTREAGNYYQIAYKYTGDYAKVGGEYVEAIYYDENVTLDNITFENGERECEYGRIVVGAGGEWFLHLANLANQAKDISLVVSLSQDNSLLTYTYRIKVLPNVTTSAVYPFATGANGAEYETISTDTTFDLAKAFGSYAGDKASETRYKLTVATTAGPFVIDETKKYYIEEGLFIEANGYKILPANSKIYDEEGNELATLVSDVYFSLENVGASVELDEGSGEFFVPILLTSTRYDIAEIKVGGNTIESGDGAIFNNFVNSGDSYTQELATGVMFVVQYEVTENTKKFTILANDQVIAKITLSKDGKLDFKNIDGTYFINLVITKTYNNIVDGNIDYRLNINNTSGINYIEYKDGGNPIPSQADDLGVVETQIETDKEYALQTKYTTGNGTSNKDLDLTYTAKLEDRRGQEVADLTKALSAGGQGNLGAGSTNDKATYGVLLVKNNSGNYTLYINRADFVDQDYTLRVFFNAKTTNENGGEESFRVSEFVVTIKSSIVATLKEGAIPVLNAGTTLNASDITTFFDVTGGTITSVKIESMENGKPCVYAKDSTLADMVTDIEEKYYDFVLTAGGNTVYLSLPFAIRANIVPLEQYKYPTVHYATEEIVVDYYSFFTSPSFGNVEAACSIPETFKDYIDSASISTARPDIKFSTNHVASRVKNVRLNLTFTYTFETYTYKFNSALVFDIEPFAILTTHTPNPSNEVGGELEYESVIFANPYTDFFSSFANFVVDNKDRLEIKKAQDSSIIANYDDIIVTLKQIEGIEVYAKVKTNVEGDFGDYYRPTVVDGKITSFYHAQSIETYLASNTYYILFNPRQLEETLAGDQEFVFMPYGAYADGYAIFDIEYHKVKATYKVYAFKEIIEQEVVNSVNYVDGVEEIFLEQLAEGNILAEDTVACLEMTATVPSGTYFIKINNATDSVNPKHWVGFKYDATKGSKIYVHLGQVGYINEANKNDTGYIEGVFASKTSINDLRENGTITLSLTSFLNLKYVTMINGEKSNVEINRDYDYTSILEAVIQRDGEEISNTIPTPLYKDVDGRYYTIDADGNKTEETIDEALLKKALYGNYEVYSDYINWDGNKYFVSSEEEIVEDSGNGFGQAVEEETGTLGSNPSKNVYRYSNAAGEKVYVETNEVTHVYDTAVKIINPGLQAYPVLYGQTVTPSASLPAVSGVANITNPYFDQAGYRYYINPDNVKFNNFEAYEVADIENIDTGISYATTTGTTIKPILVFTSKITGLGLGSAFVNPSGTQYRSITLNASTYATYQNYIKAYNTGISVVESKPTGAFDAAYTYYIEAASVQTVNETFGVAHMYYKTTALGGSEIYFNSTFAAYAGCEKVFIKVNNASSNAVNLATIAGYANRLIVNDGGSPKVVTISGKKLTQMHDASGNNFTITDGATTTKYYIENLNSISYKFTTPYNATVAVKLDATPILASDYPQFVIDEDHTTTIANVNISDKGGFGATKLPIKLKDGSLYIIGDLTLDPDTDALYEVLSTGVKTVYKEKTSRYKVLTPVSVDDLPADKKVDIDTDGEIDFYIHAGKYFRAKDVIAKVYSGSDAYIIASLQTFNINNVDGLVVNDTAVIKFNYVLDNHVGQMEFKFKIMMDADVKNSIIGTEYTENAKKLLNAEGEEVLVAGDKTINVIELQTNRTYNFNELVGAIRPSSGEFITADNVRSSSDMSIEVLTTGSIHTELPKLGMSISDINKLSTTLGDDFKDNTDIIRLSYELVRTNDNIHGKVFNFNLLPLGADNDGDYVLVKYSYNIEVGDYIWKTTDLQTYSISRYVLFYILPDYEVTMKDTDNNPVVTRTTLEDVNNFDNPVLITDFEKIGEIIPSIGTETLGGVANRKSLRQVLIDNGVTAGDIDTNVNIGEEQSGTKKFTISFKYGYQKTTVTNSNQIYSAMIISVEGAEDKTYFFRNTENSENEILYNITTTKYYVKPSTLVVYENVQLPIYTNTQEGFIRVVAKNAYVDATKNIVSAVFGSTVKDFNSNNDIATYLETAFSDGYDSTNHTLAKGHEGLRLAIKQVIGLGERNFQIVLVDDYGFTINFYFSMVATANPAYATGLLEFQEKSTYDIGAQFEEVSISQYVVNTSTNIFYPVGTLKTFENGETYYYISNRSSGSNWMVRSKNLNSALIPNTLTGDNKNNETGANVSDGIPDADMGIVFADATLIGAAPWTDTSKVERKNVTIQVKTEGTPVANRVYYKLLESGTVINETQDVNVALNLPKGYGNGDQITTMTVSTKEFVVIPTSILQVAAEGISTVIKSPEENPTATPTEEQLKYYVDTIELTGINAFGFKKQNMQKNGATENRYFRTGCDLEKIKVKQIEYAFKGVSLKTETYDNTLASSERYYKYNSSAVIGRYVDITKYEIPTLPGWVYENKDYAYVTLNITLGDDTGERYVLPIEIKVSKYSENIISQKAAATNVSDDVAFNVATHINAEAALNYTYYDDSIAITLPGNGKVSVRVEAKYDYTTIASPENKYYLANGTAVGNGAGYDNNDLYVKLGGKFYKAYYSGVKTLYSNYATMDSIQMLGLSQTVGHTLNTNYDVKVSFFDYDNERVTRDGNFGFYATYGVDNLVQDGNGGQLTDDKTLLDSWSAGDYSYAFGYGQMEENGNLGEFTLIADGTTNGANRNYIVVPTESIVRGDTDKLPIGTKFVSRANHVNKVGEVKNITINNGVNAGGETEKWQQYNNTASNFDKINVPDAGNLVDGKLLITRYYLARCGAGDANGQTYQFMKDYKVYPRYFDLSTTDPINNRIESTAGAVETVDGIAYHTFDRNGWGGDVILTYYGTIGSSSTVRLNAVDNSPFYFELGEKGTTSAKIDPDTGKLYAKTSEYKLNGDEYISINIYVKASGENRKYIDDNLPFSGNDNNKPKITVKIYLNSGLTMFERLTKIETDYASSWSNADVPTDRDEILGYFRSAESSYTSAEWTAFAGKTDKIVAEFVPLVATDAFLSSLRGMGTYSPSVDWSIDFTHFFAALDMYNNTSNKTYNMVTLTPQQIADLGGWGGDLASVIVNQIKGGVSDEATALANALSLIKATSGSSFGLLDYCANIDASNLWHTKLKSNATIKIGTAMQEYYDSKTTTKLKVESYLLNEFAYTYGTKADELAEIEYLAGLIQSRIAGNNGIKGYIAGQCGITNPLEILGIHSTYAAQISGVCEAYAIKLINDLK